MSTLTHQQLALYCAPCSGTDATPANRGPYAYCGRCGYWARVYLVPKRPDPVIQHGG